MHCHPCVAVAPGTARAMTDTAPLTRPQLRRLLRDARRALSPAEQRRAARGLYRQLAQHPLFRRARHIALYLPNDSEIDPRLLLREAQRRGKHTYLPVLHAWPRTRMAFQRFEHESATTGPGQLGRAAAGHGIGQGVVPGTLNGRRKA
uniref:5-formyltetrahydrofolate cyclo-ligase n=1 Tax=Steinernema glaseri TaxID=37863 RepID=A0A1I8AD58_9BILA